MMNDVADDPAEARSTSDPRVAAADMRAAIAAVLFEDSANLDIRQLWTHGPVTYFRVNWWTTGGQGGPHIRRSAFISVTREPDAYRVLEHKPSAAA